MEPGHDPEKHILGLDPKDHARQEDESDSGVPNPKFALLCNESGETGHAAGSYLNIIPDR
jgi:hypothetical protein